MEADLDFHQQICDALPYSDPEEDSQ